MLQVFSVACLSTFKGIAETEKPLFGRHRPPLSAALDFARVTNPACTVGGSVLDVGARGAAETSEILSADYHAIAVECQPDEYVRLHQHWKYNSNVTLLNMCASNDGPEVKILYNAEGATTLQDGTLNHHGERLRHRAALRKTVPVIAMPLDMLLWHKGAAGLEPSKELVHPVCGVKVDVQGHEKAVLQGLTETLRRYQPVIYYEFEGRFAMSYGTKEFIEGLGLGYICLPDERGKPRAAHLPPMPCKSGYCDVICAANTSVNQTVAYMRNWIDTNTGSPRIRPELRAGLGAQFVHKEGCNQRTT